MRTALIWIIAAAVPAMAWGGVWGSGSFDNDDALDWVENELAEHGHRAVDRAVATVLSDTAGYLELPTCAAAVAACEVLAAWHGKAGKDVPPDVLAMIQRFPGSPDDRLREHARRALDRIVEDSEFQSILAEGGGAPYDGWKKSMASLRRRLE